jgi:hypothetical protein
VAQRKVEPVESTRQAGGGITRRRVLQGALAAAVAGSGAGRAAYAQTGKLDVVKGHADASCWPMRICTPAIDKGIFAKYGIENQIDSVDLIASLPIVARGQLRLGPLVQRPGYFNAINSGLAGGRRRGPVDLYLLVRQLLVGEHRRTTTPACGVFADLKGKVIGINAPGSATDYWGVARARRKQDDAGRRAHRRDGIPRAARRR